MESDQVITRTHVDELLIIERNAAAYLYREAQLLDHYRYRDWLNLLSRDVEYRAPIRTSREAAHSPGFSEAGFHFDETWGRLDQRIRRLETEYAWAEDPPSRVRRFVTNVLVEPDSRPDHVRVSSYLLVSRARLEDVQSHFLSAERQDVLRDEGDGYRLLNRLILLDHTIVPTPNLGIFL
jgi:3-phenylpropionate/cinnamic acid dioxygenase small subunit